MGTVPNLATMAVLLSVCPLHALAQTAISPSSSNDESIPEIVVTADKRPEMAVNVANSLSVVTGDTLLALNARGPQDLSTLVPGLTIFGSSNGLGGSAVIRGITSTASQASPTVGTVIDGVPIGSSTGFGIFPFPIEVNFFDLDRVEVLRGPQGTIYGANSLSGLISYVTKLPSLTTPNAGVNVQGAAVDGGANGYDASGGFTIPLVQDHVGLRISGYYNSIPGYVSNPRLGIKNIDGAIDDGVRASLLIVPVEPLRMRLTYNFQDVNSRSDDSVNYSYVTQRPVAGPLQQNLAVPQASVQRFNQVYGSLDYDMHFATLTNLTGYSVADSEKTLDFSNTPVANAVNTLLADGLAPYSSLITPVATHKFSEEVRLTSPNAGTFRWLVGGFYTYEKTEVGPQLLVPLTSTFKIFTPLNPSFTAGGPTTFRESAGFADLAYDLTDRIELGGARVTAVTRKVFRRPKGVPSRRQSA